MRGDSFLITVAACSLLAAARRPEPVAAQTIRYAGADAELAVFRVSDRTIEVRLAPLAGTGVAVAPARPEILVDYTREELWRGRTLGGPVRLRVGDLKVEIEAVRLLDERAYRRRP